MTPHPRFIHDEFERRKWKIEISLPKEVDEISERRTIITTLGTLDTS